jgi:hypothetical protein
MRSPNFVHRSIIHSQPRLRHPFSMRPFDFAGRRSELYARAKNSSSDDLCLAYSTDE